MSNKLSLSVILPIKSSKTKDFEDYFEKAITSLKNQKIEFEELVIVHTNEESLVTILNNYDFGNLTVTKLPWDKTPNYAEQVNYGIKNAKGTWISLFEFDDEYASIWFKNVETYIGAYPEIQMFLPVVVETDEKGVFAGFTNEATFAANFTQEMGFLTNETLQDYQNFQTAGSVFKKEIVEDFGGFKPSFKLTFIYEFLLRITVNGAKVMVIPRFGYKHQNQREGSLFAGYTNEMNIVEANWWLEQAKKEYFHSKERDIKYEAKTN